MSRSRRAWSARTRAPAFLAGVILLTISAFAAPAGGSSSNVPVASTWVEPLNGYGFVADAINAARTSVDLSIYELVDPTIVGDLIARASAGVDVRVLLDSADGGADVNATTVASLRAGGVNVEWAPSAQTFHAKYLVIDATTAYVGSANLVATDYPSTRDYWVKLTSPGDVHAVATTFDGDFNATTGVAVASPGLVWSPGATGPIVRLITSARHSLLVENEEMSSAPIELALEHAAARGVNVKVVMTASATWATALAALVRHGVHVRTLRSTQLYIHAKAICVDCTSAGGTVFVGSENFSRSSLSDNRELGVITRSRGSVRAVLNAAMSDYRLGSTVH